MKIKKLGVFRNSRAKMLVALFLVAGAFFVFWAVQKSQAGALTINSVTLGSQTPNADDVTYTIALTTSLPVPTDGYFKIVFQQNMGLFTAVPDGISSGGATIPEISTITRDGDNQLHAEADSQVDAGEVTLQVTGLSNPPAGQYCVSVWTVDNMGAPIDGIADDYNCQNGENYTIGMPIVSGQVTGPDDAPLANAWINVHTDGPTPLWGGTNTDAEGNYTIGNLNGSTPENGTVIKISAWPPPEKMELGQWGEEVITFEGLTIADYDIQFTEPTKTITGTVTYADGDPVVGARINFWSSTGSGWAEGTTDDEGNIKASNGTSDLKVRGGKWEGNPQADQDDDWSYGKPPMSITFANNSTEESKEIDFIVERASCTVTGSVRLPNGSVPNNPQEFWVGVHSMMSGGGMNLDEDGNFSVNVAPGTYNVEVSDWQQNYAAPKINPITLVEGDTTNLGTITLVERNSHIVGRAVDAEGNGVANLRLNSFMISGKGDGGGGWAEDTTDGDGDFSMNVFPGRWMVQVSNWGNDDLTYVLDGNPREVKVDSGDTVTVEIPLLQTNSTISGSIVDVEGNVVSDMYGWVFAERTGGGESHFGPGLGGSVERGNFEFNVPAGTYEVGFGTMPGSEYSSGDMQEVTVGEDDSVSHNVIVYENDLTVTGTVRDENGDPVTDTFMEIFAVNDNGGWQNAMIDQSNGTYTIDVASAVDPWNLGYFIDPSTGYFSQKLTDSDVSGDSGDTMTMNITVRRADATISGRVLDGDGNPMEGVFAFADNRSGDKDRQEAEFMGPMFMNDSITDANGNFSLQVPNGTYMVGASLPRDGNETLINPEFVETTVGPNGTASGVTLAFRNADATISGTVLLDGSPLEDAFVWAWSETGGYSETKADDNGTYELNVTQGDIWHIGVNSDVVDSTDYIRSTEYTVDTGSETNITQDIALETITDGLVAPVSTTFDADSPKATSLSDGTQITVPANTMGEEGEVITLNAFSTSELPRTENAKPIATGLELTATASNQEEGSTESVTSFNSNVTISIPYDEADIESMLLTEDDLVAAYWDETAGIWQPMESYTIDKENDVVTFSTNHFTIFSIVGDGVGEGDDNGSNDSSEEEEEAEKADVDSWKAERFFSDASGKDKMKLVIKGHNFDDDANVEIGTRDANSIEVDSDGEKITAKFSLKSLNMIKIRKRTIQVTNPGTRADKAKKKINLDHIPIRLSGSINSATTEGIKNIQTILYNKNFLGEKYITGFFGPLTSQAVRMFQAKFGLPQTGTVGPLTEEKMKDKKDNL